MNFSLNIDAWGVWHFCDSTGDVHDRVVVVRAFPIGAPHQCISILNSEGRELLWIDDLSTLPQEQKDSLLQAVTQREFMPEIQKLNAVSSFVAPCTWFVKTNRGEAEFLLKGEEDIRRLSSQTLIVADAHGVQFLIRDLPSMDKHSRKLLDRFL